MAVGKSALQSLRYGDGLSFPLELPSSRIVRCHKGPPPATNFAKSVRGQLDGPLDFPPLEFAVVPDDKIIVALDRDTPGAATIVAELWTTFKKRSIRPDDVTILQPASWKSGKLPDPRAELPKTVRESVHWKIHDATDKKNEAFLANSAGGERLYLAREVIDADHVLPVGAVGFDPLLGIRSAGSAIFPGLSNVDAISKTRGQEHVELRPEDERPLRQLQDEVAWLLGIQCGVQVLPSSSGQPAGVIFGALEASASNARMWLRQNWHVGLEQRAEIVVACVDADSAGTTWDHVCAAAQTARKLVQRGGKIILLTDLAAEPTEGFEYLRQSEIPREALKPLRLESPPDLISVSRLASATDWATVYLLSNLKSEVVESLFMTPLATAAEATRLLSQDGSCVLLESAQNVFGYVT